VSLPLASIEIDTGESITKDNPKLVSLAQQAKAGSAWVTLSAYLSQGAKNSSAAEQTERSQILQRMYQIRDVLQTLGVPADRIDVNRPTGYATSAHGQVSVTAKAAGAGLPAPAAPIPGQGPSPGSAPLLGPQPGPPIPGKGPSLGDLLTVKFGPVTVDLPASIKAKLPVAISAGKSLVIELSADVPAKFEFKLTLDGTPHVRVSAGVSAEFDPGKKSAMGSAGLTIETTATTCHATNPEEVRAKIKGAGDKLMKAGKEFGEATDPEGKLKKLADIAGAIAEMYGAVDKSKSACKQEPRAKFEFGTKFPLAPGSETDRTKLSPYVGGTITIPF
jgi:hypothetical protein